MKIKPHRIALQVGAVTLYLGLSLILNIQDLFKKGNKK